MKTILILSYAEDAHADYVKREAEERGLHVRRIDLYEYPKFAASMSISDEEPVTSIIDGLSSEDITGVWCRRTGGIMPRTISDHMEKYIAVECNSVLSSLATMMPNANWVSEPKATELANRKIVQLTMARKVGFSIPKTMVGNSPDEVSRFVNESEDKPIIMKPASSAVIRLSDEPQFKGNKIIHTKIVDKDQILQNLEKVSCCPVIFQYAVLKEYDLRVTIIGRKVFSAKIVAENNDPRLLDWRGMKREYLPHTLPKDIEEKCIAITEALGLRFGCIDLGYSEQKGYTFFEINPQGQWLPSQKILGYNISGCLIDLLGGEISCKAVKPALEFARH